MYIPVDRETKFRLPVPEEDGDLREHRAIKCIASNREKNFMAVITSDCIYIWLAYPHLLLCTLRISAGDVIERGTLNKAYWNYDSSHIVIMTSRNNLLIYRVNLSKEDCYNLIDPPDIHLRRSSQELFLCGPRPSLSLSPSVVVNLAASAMCCVPLREDLFVCLRNGFMHHISWDGQIRADYSIRISTVPFAHDQLQSKPEYVSGQTTHVVDAVYAPLVGGYCIVLSDGRAALLTSSDSQFHPNSILGVWALNMKDALCTDVNHKFRLLTFGCINGDVAAYHLDDADGSLVQTFRVALKVLNGPDVVNRVGSVSDIKVLTSGGAFVAVWSSKKVPIVNGTDSIMSDLPPTLAVFTPFGTQTWCSLESLLDSEGTAAVSYTSVDWGPEGYHIWLGRNDGLSILPMARSAALFNPIMGNTSYIVLLCSSRILISSRRERESVASAPHAVWTTLNPPHEYIASNWPIPVDSNSAKTIVVAGLRGFAHCNVSSGRWKIFGNEYHESSLMVTGGVLVWNGTIGVACYDVNFSREQLRFYPVHKKLDNQLASIHEIEYRVIMMSLRSNALVTFDIDGRILIYRLYLDGRSADARKLSQPIMVASFVEQVWHYRALTDNEPLDPPHLLNALWINCGSRGLKVWLPLISARRGVVTQDTSFISKRIMLPFELDICPLVISSSECLAVGVESLPFVTNNGSHKTFTVYNLNRNCEVFGHHILRQLLKRNLGVFALEVASACRNLPHFAHSLELLLHGVLEEEATSSEPIPDPLLPRCVAFIQEFPEFLRTVVHCARKTELALWSSLFEVTGSPNALFEVCIRDGQLRTAASYLIVLQSIESAHTSQEQALRLLREALLAGEWSIARDMVRFSRAIGSEDLDDPARASPPLRMASRRHAASTSSAAETDDLIFARFQAGDLSLSNMFQNSLVILTLKHTSDELSTPSPSSTSPIVEKMDAILDSHGVHLLENYYVRDLGYFISALDLDISRILSSPSSKYIKDFPLALNRLHNQFEWPYPIVSKKLVDQLEKRFGNLRCNRSSSSLNGELYSNFDNSMKHLGSRAITLDSRVLGCHSSSSSGGSIADAQLIPIRENGIASRTSPVESPCSSVVCVGDTTDVNSTNVNDQGANFLVGETSNCGSVKNLAQMSQLISWFSANGCIDWVFLICVVSRDIARLRLEVNSDSVIRAGLNTFEHTMFGCQDLMEWASRHCLGYVSILHVFATHLNLIAEANGLPRLEALKRSSIHNLEKFATEEKEIAPTPRAFAAAPNLKDSFGLSDGHEKKRKSFDNGSSYAVASLEKDKESCVLM
ncbi:RIC1 protein [Dictyocaulus viviparus]|uniref:Protein RIC1 homolog n=1 Tax=Dictyocaulus viviparus TaxID=29172 RepID=A0A0D8XIB0_DICVI|nr:RIC1 protein [Dictyocaulus viviparus]